jgi:divalent metal cation (Fe/Co/Zn/Cd) transporter
MRQSFRGLMDEVDPVIDRVLRRILDEWAAGSGGRYHALRHRGGGAMLWVEVHLLFPGQQDLETVHAAATALENRVHREFSGCHVIVTTHLEPLDRHAEHHPHDGLEHAEAPG